MILIKSLNANTAVKLINGQPDLSGFQEPTKSILKAAFDAGKYDVLPDVVSTPIALQADWDGLNAVCLGGALNPLYSRLTAACFVNPSTATIAQLGEANNIAVAKGLMDQAVAVTQIEGAVAASINLLIATSSYRFTNAEKTLWNTTVTSLGFSSTIHIG